MADFTRQTGLLPALEWLLEYTVFPAPEKRGFTESDLFHAGLRVLLRLVLLRTAEQRRLLPVSVAIYRDSYSLTGLSSALSESDCHVQSEAGNRGWAWARIRALFALVYGGSPHPDLPLTPYGGGLFEPASAGAGDGLQEALRCLERPHSGPPDWVVRKILEALPSGDVGTDSLGQLYETALEYRLTWLAEPTVLPAGRAGPAIPRARWRMLGAEVQRRLTESGQGGLELPGGRWLLQQRNTTRKGRGCYYTPRRLARAVVRRAIEPLCFRGGRILLPRSLLRLRICDPAMGSGAFLVEALALLTDKVIESARVHGLVSDTTGPGRVYLAPGIRLELPVPAGSEAGRSLLAALVRRQVVEHCLYGLDLDPLAVELARCSLWLETMDSRLPLSFLDHKLKRGDALVGAWCDDLADYPIAALKRPVEGPAAPLLQQLSRRATSQLAVAAREEREAVLPLGLPEQRIRCTRDRLEQAMARVHRVPVELPDAKRKAYRADLQQTPGRAPLQHALDLWCALWFWPSDELRTLPMPVQLPAALAGEKRWPLGQRIAGELHFCHWELEFPEVFAGRNPGFHALVGNPPWEVLKPDHTALFERLDPLWSMAPGGNNAERIRQLLRMHPDGAREWRIARERTAALLHFLHAAGSPGRSRPFLHQGRGDSNTYKLFLEQADRLCRSGGRLGLVLPAALYSDEGSALLRRNLVRRWQWEWLVGFENRARIFPIDSRFRFAVIVARKGGRTRSLRTLFLARQLSDLEEVEERATRLPQETLRTLRNGSPLFELANPAQHRLLARLVDSAHPLLATGGLRYHREVDAALAAAGARPRPDWLTRGWHPDRYGLLWPAGERGRPQDAAFPVVQGVMVGQLKAFAAQWRSGSGRTARWQQCVEPERPIVAQHYLSGRDVIERTGIWPDFKVAVRRITNATNERTVIASVVPGFPCNDKAAVLVTEDRWQLLFLAGLLNSFVMDFVARTRCVAANLDRHHLSGFPWPPETGRADVRQAVALLSLRLVGDHAVYAPLWMEAASRFPRLRSTPWQAWWFRTRAERTRARAVLEALVAFLYRVPPDELAELLAECHHSRERLRSKPFVRTLDPRGFWRTDRDLPPAARLPVQTLAASRILHAQGPGVLVRCLEPDPGDGESSWAVCAADARAMDEIFQSLRQARTRGGLPFAASPRQTAESGRGSP